MLVVLSIVTLASDVNLEAWERLGVDAVVDGLGLAAQVGVSDNGVAGEPSVVALAMGDSFVVDVGIFAEAAAENESKTWCTIDGTQTDVVGSAHKAWHGLPIDQGIRARHLLDHGKDA